MYALLYSNGRKVSSIAKTPNPSVNRTLRIKPRKAGYLKLQGLPQTMQAVF